MAQSQTARRPGVNVFDESRPMWQTMLVFLAPLMLSNILQSASQTITSIFLGRMIGVKALGAVSAVFPPIFLLISFFMGLANGSTVLIGQAYGAGDHHRVKKVAGTTLGATFALGILAAVFGTMLAPYLIAGLGTPSDIAPMSVAYLRVIFLSCPIFLPYLMYTTFLRGTGDAQTPFYFLVVTTVLSLLFVPALIAGWFGLPHLGVVGAAIGSMGANVITFAAFLIYLARTNNSLKFDRETASDMLVDWKILWQVLRIGVPTGIQVMMVALAEIAILRFVNSFGSNATAAYGAVNQIVGYVQFPAISIGIAASIFGAQCIGARREELLGSVVRSAVTLNWVVGGILIALCYAFAWVILGWFITDNTTLNIAHGLLMITLWSYLLFGNSAVISGVMRSSGVVFWPTINGIFAIWGVEVPAALILMQHFGLNGIWMAYPISYFVVLCLQLRYYEFHWKGRMHQRFA